MRNLIVTLLAGFCFGQSYGADGWIAYSSTGPVKIFYRYIDCNDPTNGINKQKVIFRYENTGGSAATLSFNRTRAYTGQTTGKEDVSFYEVKLAPGQVIEGDCATRDNALFIFSKHLDMEGGSLKNFELKNIAVKPIE